MKKRILSMLLAVCLCVSLLPMVALAADGDYEIKVCGISVSTTGYVTVTGISGGENAVYYDASTHTLTLNNATLTSEANVNAISASFPRGQTLTIHLVGTNKIISGGSCGIILNTDAQTANSKRTLVFTGTNASTDTLDISFQDSSSREGSWGIRGYDGIIIVQSGAAVTVTAGNATQNSLGIDMTFGTVTVEAGARLVATGGTVTRTDESGDVACRGISVPNGTVIVNGTLEATGGKATATSGSVFSHGLYTKQVVVRPGARLTATGGDANSTGAQKDAFSYGIWADGNIEINGTLTAKGGTATSSSNRASSYGVYAVNATVTGTLNTDAGTATGTNGRVRCYGLLATEAVTVASGGTLTANQYAAAAKPKDTAAAQNADAPSYTSGDANGLNTESYGVSAYTGLTVEAGGKLTAYGGSVTGTNDSPWSYGVYVKTSLGHPEAKINGTVTAVGGKASGTGRNSAYSCGFMLSAPDDDSSLTVGAQGSLTATGGETTVSQSGTPRSIGILIESGNNKKVDVTLCGGTLIAQTAAALAAENGTEFEVVPTESAPNTRAAVTEPSKQDVGLLMNPKKASVVDIQSGTAKFSGRDCGFYVQHGNVQVGVGSENDVELHAKATGTGGKAIYALGDWVIGTNVCLVTPAGGSIYTGTTGASNGQYSTILNPDESVAAEALLRRAAAQDEPQDETEDTLPGWLAPIIGALDQEPFDDVTTRDWFYDDVNYVNEYGLMTGTGYRTFSPNAPVTRGMVMTILARREGIKTDRYSPWYAAGVEWAKANGISDGSNPEAPITREQLAAMLYRYAGLKGYDLSGAALAAFGDANSISGYAVPAVQWAVGAGLLTGAAGVHAGKLLPQETATRAQLAAILHRFFG